MVYAGLLMMGGGRHFLVLQLLHTYNIKDVVIIYIYIYPNRAYFRYGKLSCRFYTFCVFFGGGSILKIKVFKNYELS